MKTKILFILFIVIALFQGCTEEIEIKLDSSYTRLIVDGSITTDTTAHCVRLLNSANYFYNKPLEPVKNAYVAIFNGTDSIHLTESTEEPGYYYTEPDVYGEVGKTYNLLIKNVDINKDNVMETYTAQSYLPPVDKADSINLAKSNFMFVDYEVRYFGMEPPTKDYYYFKLRRNGNLLTDTLTESYPSDDEFYNGNYLVKDRKSVV